MKQTAIVLSLMLISLNAFGSGESDVHWAYEGAEGPEHWAELSDKYSLCRDGKNQSPIDLVSDFQVDLPELRFEYHGTPLRETNNGHTIMLTVAPGNFLEIPEKQWRYQLQQGHFHSPSEHTVNGESFPMEIHLVHQGDDGILAVVGIMVEEGEEDPMLNRIWSFMPEQVGETKESPLSVFEAGVLPPTRNYFTYDGSLTTPPCTEGIQWFVLRNPLTASPEQIARFKERVGPSTNRPTQPHNARMILD